MNRKFNVTNKFSEPNSTRFDCNSPSVAQGTNLSQSPSFLWAINKHNVRVQIA